MSVVILGAGLAGLAAAQRLRESNVPVVVYEKKPYVGGRAYSHKVQGFVFDQGPHASFTRKRKIQTLLAAGVRGQLVEHQARVTNYWGGHWLPHPAQCNLYGLPGELVTRCIVDLVKAQYEEGGPIVTYADWCRRGLGTAFSEAFTFPYTRKYWTAEAQDMTAEWVGPRVYSPTLEEVVRGAVGTQSSRYHYINRIRYPLNGGFGAFVQAVMGDSDVHLGCPVTTVDLRKRVLELADGQKVHYEQLISSLPLPELIRLIKDAPRAVVGAAEQLTCTSVVLVNVGIDRAEGLPDAHWFYVYDEDVVFARVNLPHRMSPNNAPDGCASLQFETYYSTYRPLPCEDIVSRTMEDATRIGVLRRDDRILVSEEERIHYANILFDHKRDRNLAVVQRYLREHDVISCGRYGEWAYYWSDDSILSGWRAASAYLKRSRGSASRGAGTA
jgi:protoporphyrinogen oxidase